MKRLFAILSIVLTLGLIVGLNSVFAATYEVPGTFPKVSQALNAASAGDIIRITGTVTEANITVDKNVTIEGSTAIATDTILQAATAPFQSNAGRVFEVTSGATVTIKNLTIQNGNAPAGGDGADIGGANTGTPGEDGGDGGAILNNGILTLENCIFKNNRAGKGGNGSIGETGTKGEDRLPGTNGCNVLIVPKCPEGTIDGGDGSDGEVGGNGSDGGAGGVGGAGGDGGAIANNGTLTLSVCTFENNLAGGGGLGGTGGTGGNGGQGGNGGNGGNANTDTGEGLGGDGGNGNIGGNGGNGGVGGQGGNGGNGGAIFNTGTLSGEGTCSFDANMTGSGGDGGSPGSGGNGGNGGNAGRGGIHGDLSGTGATGIAAKGGTGGASGSGSSGQPGSDPIGTNGGYGGYGGVGGASAIEGDLGLGNDVLSVPNVTTISVTYDIQTKTATVAGNVSSAGTGIITQKGICWSTTNQTPTIGDTIVTHDNTAFGDYTRDITGLTSGQVYYVRAYSTNSMGVSGYGEVWDFTFPSVPTVFIIDVPDSTKGIGKVEDTGGDTITERGICWSTTIEPSHTNGTCSTSDSTAQTGEFEAPISGMLTGMTYYVRAYAVNGVGIGYSSGEGFTYENPDKPIVTTDTVDVSTITASSATGRGEVTSDGGATVTEKGICWSKSPNPTTDCISSGITGLGAFTVELTGLDPYTLYYVKAYATNSGGSGYGSDTTFRTLAGAPEVETGTDTDWIATTTTVTINNNEVISDGGDSSTERGVCWSKIGETTCTKVLDTTGTGKSLFSVTITGLTHSTTYYVKAYAKNSVGEDYGSLLTITTPQAQYIKVATSDTILPKGLDSATFSGTAIPQDETPIDERGFCWNMTETPQVVIVTEVTSDGTIKTSCPSYNEGISCTKNVQVSNDDFSSLISGFSDDVTYYVRAYAVNTRGIAYGKLVEYRNPEPPSVETKEPPTDITKTTAKVTGIITATSVTVTERGVCWSESEIPEGTDPTTISYTTAGTGVSEFTASLTSLTQGAMYYARAYAVTSVGTILGNQISFTTLTTPTVEITEIKDVNETEATVEAQVTAIGGADVTSRGLFWSEVSIDVTTDPPPDPTTYSHIMSTDGTGIGTFTSSLTGLDSNTQYYIRAFAINSIGTAYSEEKAFSTNVEKGDVNCDGMVDLQDAIVALKVLANIENPGTCENSYTADINGDGKVGIEEVIFILRKVLGT